MARPIFLTALARGGSNLTARMLAASEAVEIVIHGLQPLFKAWRNAAVQASGQPELTAWLDPAAPFHDGYFDPRRRAVLACLHRARFDLPLAPGGWPDLRRSIAGRADADAGDLAARLSDLTGAADFQALLDDILALTASIRNAAGKPWLGSMDTWTIDTFPALARAYPEARFIVVLRDPRGVVASGQGYLKDDPGQVGHVLSIVRQWRKIATLSRVFAADPLFAGRLLCVRYEDQLAEPEAFARQLCAFLDISCRPEMVDFSCYRDAVTGRAWSGNSTFTTTQTSIDGSAGERWRRTLDPAAVMLVEWAAGLDMPLFGYRPDHGLDELAASPVPLAFLVEDNRTCQGWRTDFDDPVRDYGFECFRRQLPFLPDVAGLPVDNCFLDAGYFNAVRGHWAPTGRDKQE